MIAALSSPGKRAGLALLALAALWLGLVNQLRIEWSINPQYSYGWGVPFLALYLLLQRWRDRPEAAAPQQLKRHGAAVGFLAFALLPMRLIQEANPDWRLVSWSYGFIAVLITLITLHAQGGKPWLRHFSFPICFMLVAVPWPTPVEANLIQSLMRGVAFATVEWMNWSGIAAAQNGNLIALSNGVVGVDEACSGVRSLQGTLMASLFFGELYRLKAPSRVILTTGGIIVSVLLNFARTLFLTWTAAKDGIEAINRWHDPAGYIVFSAACLILWLLAVTLARWWSRPASAASVLQPVPLLPAPAGAALLLWLLCVEGATEGWYRAHETASAEKVSWTIHWPDSGGNFKFLEVPEDVRLILRYNEGQSALWQREDGSEWLLYHFEWKPGKSAAQLARNHTPDTCLPASGLVLRSMGPSFTVRADGVDLPFRSYVFEQSGRSLYVFFCVWEQRDSTLASGAEDYSRASRFRAAWEGRRHAGQKMLEVAIYGAEGLAPAQADLEKFLKAALVSRREKK